MPDNGVLIEIVRGLAGNPALLLLCVVLVGGGWMGNRIVQRLMDGILSRVDKLDARLESIEHRLGEVVAIQGQVERLDERLDRVEAACDRRHGG